MLSRIWSVSDEWLHWHSIPSDPPDRLSQFMLYSVVASKKINKDGKTVYMSSTSLRGSVPMYVLTVSCCLQEQASPFASNE